MKKIIFSFIFSFISIVVFSQQNDNDNLYLYVKNSDFWPAMLGYKAVFTIKSKDNRFSHDNYFFKISYDNLDYQSLYNLATTIDADNISYVSNPSKYFENVPQCEVHNKLSLYKQIFVITEIPKTKLKDPKNSGKTHLIWSTRYEGTIKDLTWVNPTHKLLLED